MGRRKKLTPEQAEEIRRRYNKERVTHKQLAQEYGVCKAAIYLITNNITWTNLEKVSEEDLKKLSERAEKIKLQRKERNLKQKEDIEFARTIKTIRTKPNRHPLKPWKDPESLFCDTEFLKKLIKKTPKKGIECKDAPLVEERKK